jgi:hypothetical protein
MSSRSSIDGTSLPRGITMPRNQQMDMDESSGRRFPGSASHENAHEALAVGRATDLETLG